MGHLSLRERYLTIHYEDTMFVTDQDGWIGEERTGLYSRDTRYLSTYKMTVNGFDLRLLGGSRPYYFAHTFYYTNPRLGAEPNVVPENSLMVKLSRYVRDSVHEDIELTNYNEKPVLLTLTFTIDADFADIFQVRGLERLIPRLAQVQWDGKRSRIRMHYQKGDFSRTLVYQLNCAGSTPRHSLGTISFDLKLQHGESWQSCADMTFNERPAAGHAEEHASGEMAKELHEWEDATTSIETPAVQIARTYNRAILDLGSLRLEEIDGGWFPAAGLPWYMAVFGRDSLTTAIQTLLAHCHFGVEVLQRLAQLQGKKIDQWTEEQPGRIPHELRFGELATTGKIPHSPYYGTVDASLLYVILLHELYRFTGERELLDLFYRPAAACLDWATQYGDFDGDGFIEYRPLSPKGYRNQAWKDAWDAVVYPDGTLVSPPIAICEVQGYYYDALRRMAQIADLLGRQDEGARYQRLAKELFDRFNDVYWLEEENTYAFGLDPSKRPIATVASNPGQLLWSGIVADDRASRLARRLFAEDMFSGWGIRTLSNKNPAYDPVSYQRGAVWPHDNGIIAMGLKRYGLWHDANRIAEGIFAAAEAYERNSLPELFAGIERRPDVVPVPYVDANIPQAWASGSVFMLLRAIIGLQPDPANSRVILAPTLPAWLPTLTLRGLTVLGAKLDLHFHGKGLDSAVEVIQHHGAHIDIEIQRGDMGYDPVHPGNQQG